MVDIIQVVVMVGGGVEKKNRTKKMMTNYEKKNEKDRIVRRSKTNMYSIPATRNKKENRAQGSALKRVTPYLPKL